MSKVSFCIPSKNNCRYLKACIPSIRKNSYFEENEILVFVDEDNDGTIEWLDSVKEKYDLSYSVNNTGRLFGIGRAYDHLVEQSSSDVFMIFHADMMLGKHADLEAYNYLDRGKVVCSTRIEPPLHPEGSEKIVENFGLWPELDVEDGFKEDEFDEFVESCKVKYSGQITNGCFAPWMMYKEDFLTIGGHDFRFRSAREDSDVFNRMVLNGYKLIQSWTSFVYHLTARAGQFQHGVLTKEHSQKSPEWQKLMEESSREFIRKWGSTVQHDEHMMPIIFPKYDIGFVAHNCSTEMLRSLEPWCSDIYGDWVGHKGYGVNMYIEEEQDGTMYDLKKRIHSQHIEPTNDVVVEFDASQLNQDQFQFLTQLPLILRESGDIGKMSHGIFKFDIKSLKTYEKELIQSENSLHYSSKTS